MSKIGFSYDSFRGQCVMLLVGALKGLGGTGTRQEVLGYIAERHYFDIEAEDRLPFATDIRAGPRWELLMSLVVPACLRGGCIRETMEGGWRLTRAGAELYSRTRKLLREGTFDPHLCFLWTREFKKRLVPGYEPQPGDRHRSTHLYEVVRWHLADASPS